MKYLLLKIVIVNLFLCSCINVNNNSRNYLLIKEKDYNSNDENFFQIKFNKTQAKYNYFTITVLPEYLTETDEYLNMYYFLIDEIIYNSVYASSDSYILEDYLIKLDSTDQRQKYFYALAYFYNFQYLDAIKKLNEITDKKLIPNVLLLKLDALYEKNKMYNETVDKVYFQKAYQDLINNYPEKKWLYSACKIRLRWINYEI